MKKQLQNLKVINNIYLLCDNSKPYPLTSNYIILVMQGAADIIYNNTNYHLTQHMLLFGNFTNTIEIVNTSPEWQCVIIINTNPQVDEVIYSCLQIEKDWHKKLLFIHSHPVLTISDQVLANMQMIFQMFMAHSDSDNIYHQRIQYLLGQSVLFELFAWIDQEMQQHPSQRLEIDQSTDRKQQLMLEFMRLLRETHATFLLQSKHLFLMLLLQVSLVFHIRYLKLLVSSQILHQIFLILLVLSLPYLPLI